MKPLKRNFFHPQAKRHELAKGCIEAIKGIYASVRMSEVCFIDHGARSLPTSTNMLSCSAFPRAPWAFA